MTYEQLKQFLNSACVNFRYADSYYELFFHEEIYGNIKESIEKDLNCIIKLVENVGGSGQGETYYLVYSFTFPEDTIYVKFEGSYYSYDGATFDDFFQVVPVQKTITVYEAT